jgi:hypothetical protein
MYVVGMELSYEQALRMARTMKAEDARIQRTIRKCAERGHGVVALRFTHNGKYMEIEIEDEPYDDNVKVYPG